MRKPWLLNCWIFTFFWKLLRFATFINTLKHIKNMYLRNPLHPQTSFCLSSLVACSCNRCLQTGVQALKFRSARKSPLSTSAGCTRRLSLIAKTSALWNAMRCNEFLQVAPYHAVQHSFSPCSHRDILRNPEEQLRVYEASIRFQEPSKNQQYTTPTDLQDRIADTSRSCSQVQHWHQSTIWDHSPQQHRISLDHFYL